MVTAKIEIVQKEVERITTYLDIVTEKNEKLKN
jgi:hypothetical protein